MSAWPVTRDAYERKILGRCPSCAERVHECNGNCNCPRLACSDVQAQRAGVT